jgi:tetratricopeptide (TPR) repeat protein
MDPSVVYRSRAQASRASGDLAQARDLLALAVAAAQHEGDSVARAMNVSLLAEVEGEAGNLGLAFTGFAEAIATFKAAGDLRSAGVTYHQWAKLLYLNGRFEEAGNYFIASAQCFLANEDGGMVAAVAESFRTCVWDADEPDRRQMTQAWESTDLPPLGMDSGTTSDDEHLWRHLDEVPAAMQEANDHMAHGQWDAAYATLTRALTDAQTRSPRVALESERQYELEVLAPLRHMLAEACVSSGTQRIRESFLSADAASSRFLLQQLFNYPTSLPENLPVGTHGRVVELLWKEANSLEGVRMSTSNGVAGDPLSERERLESIWDELEALGAGEYVALRRGGPMEWQDVQRWLTRQRQAGSTWSRELSPVAPWLARGRRIAVLEFFTAERETMAFIVREGDADPTLIRLGASAQLQGMTDLLSLRSQRSAPRSRLSRVRDMAPSRRAPVRSAPFERLGAPWLDGVMPHLDGVELLYVIPHGWLHNLPLHALECQGKPLIEHFPIVYAPSVSVARRATASPLNAAIIGRTMVHGSLVMGNPTGDLPYADQEARVVAELVGIPQRIGSQKLFMGEEATVGRFLFELPGNTHVHLAAHAYFARDERHASPNSDLNAGVVMAGGEVLRAGQVQREEIDVRLLVISACESGVQETISGNELMGLARGFLCAGAASLLLALWSVNDRSTASFMRYFYGHLLSERAEYGYSNSGRSQSMSVAEALQKAMLDLRRHEEWADPYYWAPFVLIGDWR